MGAPTRDTQAGSPTERCASRVSRRALASHTALQEFFRVARARLSPDTFTAFLASIKALNAHTRTRGQTLEDAQILFGASNSDLYVQFESLLAAHLT